MPNVTSALETAPRYLRSNKSTGKAVAIDRDGGMYGAGIIRGVSVITQGEALGHGIWIDEVFNQQVADSINRGNTGVKSRFTHPGLSGDGLGRHLGRITGARVEGDQVIADQHFSKAAHETPDGNLASYLLSMAEEDPEAYGLSIAFEADMVSEDFFKHEHTGDHGFESPDEKNTQNLHHVRLGSLRAVDAVDEPAANPDGLFHREQEVAQEATLLAAYALGESPDAPAVRCLGLDPDRVRGFVSRFLDQHNLTITKKEAEAMSTENEVKEEAVEAPVAEAVETVEAGSASDESPELSGHTGNDYLEAFGDQGGVWFAQGKSFDMCLALQNKSQQEKIAALERRFSVPAETGEDTPVDFQAEEKTERKGFASKIKIK